MSAGATPCRQAVVLVGGEGKRLRPITSRLPKPATPVVGRPFIGYVIDNLARHGVEHIVFSAGYLADALRSVVGDGSSFGVTVDYAVEDEPLGTAGAIRNAERFLADETFLALNGDVLTDVDVGELVAFHRDKGGDGTIYLTPVDDPRRYGLVRLREDGSVVEFLEKPGPEHSGRALINAGIYVLEPRILELIPPGRLFSIERGIFPKLAEQGILFGFSSECYWRDIGTPASYLTANFDVLEGALRTRMGDQLGQSFLYVSHTACIAADARVVPPAYIDLGVRIESGARVGPLAVIGAGSTIADGATVQESVIHDQVHVGVDADVRSSVLARRAEIGEGAQVNAAIIGEACRVGRDNELARGLCLAPDTYLPAGSITFRDVVDHEGDG